MDRQKTIDIIDALAHGVNPLTGNNIGPKGVVHVKEIKEALHRALAIIKTKNNQHPYLEYYQISRQKLQEASMKGHSIFEIAERFHCTPEDVAKRLSKNKKRKAL